MTTFDLALKYLSKIDFSNTSIYNENEGYGIGAIEGQIFKVHEEFLNDVDNHISNEYYRSLVYQTAMLHLIFKASERVSFFDIACEIVRNDIELLKTDFIGFTPGSIYPKIMVDNWNVYNKDLFKDTRIINDESNLEYFMVAFHYVKDPYEV